MQKASFGICCAWVKNIRAESGSYSPNTTYSGFNKEWLDWSIILLVQFKKFTEASVLK